MSDLLDGFWNTPQISDFEGLILAMREKKIVGEGPLPCSLHTLWAISDHVPQYDYFIRLYQDVKSWASCLGGIEVWPDTLDIAFERAYARGYAPTSRFVERLFSHELARKQLLRNLQSLEGRLPCNNTAIRVLWSY